MATPLGVTQVQTRSDDPTPPTERPRVRFGLSAKLLVMTVLFVMLAEVLIYVPSIANFRLTWLNDKLTAAHTAALVFEASPMVPESLSSQILDSIGARALAMKMGQQRRLLATAEPPTEVLQDVDVRDMMSLGAIVEAFRTLLVATDTDLIRAIGPAPMGGEFVEIVIEAGPLRRAMWRYSRNVLLLSIAISAISAALVYFALHYLFVRPLYRITGNMMAFRSDPENPARVLAASPRRDEIGIVERELADMQRDLASTLQHKTRLATLGLAVSKINHDLRNLLASAQLFSDRLAGLPDPQVQRFAPKLMRRRPVALAELVEEVRDTLGVQPETRIGWIAAVERGLIADADHDQLLRILVNLARNAQQALESRQANDPARDQIRITGQREGAVVIIEVADTGPGFSEQARAHLFEAFQGSTRTGGTGLGLAIAAELVRAHGGEINLVEGTIGATFRIRIPDRPIPFPARRDERARA
jgi:hypothetical protein